jgi:hypothetical protein
MNKEIYDTMASIEQVTKEYKQAHNITDDNVTPVSLLKSYIHSTEEANEWKKKCEEAEAHAAELEQENRNLETSNSNLVAIANNLKSRAVPDEYQYRYSYLVYQDAEDKDNLRTFQLVRRLTKDIEARNPFMHIIASKNYFYYVRKLPIGMSVSDKVIEICKKAIPGCQKISRMQRILIPLDQFEEFRKIINRVVHETHQIAFQK